MKFLLVASLSVACVQGFDLLDDLGDGLVDVADGLVDIGKDAIGGVVDFTKQSLQDLTPDEWAKISLEQIKSLTWEKIGEMTGDQWDKLSFEKRAAMGWEQLQQSPSDMWEKVSTDVIGQFDVDKLFKLTGEQFAKIPADAVGKKFQDVISKIPIHILEDLTVPQLTALGLENFDADQLASLTKKQWAGLQDKIVNLGAKGLKAVDYDSLAALAEDTWNKIPFEDIKAGIVGEKIRSIPTAITAEWDQKEWDSFPVKEYIMFSGEQLSTTAALEYLSVDNLAQYARSGNLDLDLLTVESKAQFKTHIDQLMTRIEEMGMTYKQYVAEGKTVVDNVKAYDKRQGEVDEAEANLEALRNDISTSQADIRAAEVTLQQAEVLEHSTGQKLVSAGYLSAEDLRNADNSPASRAAPAVLAFVAMAIALVAM